MDSLYQELKDSFVGELTVEDQQELAKFASALMQAKASDDAARTDHLVKQAAAEVSDLEDFSKLAHAFLHLEKTAKTGKMSNALEYGLKGALLMSAVAPLASQLYNSRKASSAYKKSYNEVLQEHPNLSNGTALDQTKRNFEALKQFSPDVAKNSLVAGNVLQRMHRAGPALMDINMVKELSEGQKNISQYRDSGKGTSGNLSSAIKGVQEFTAKEAPKPVPEPKSALDTLQGSNAMARAELDAADLQRRKMRSSLGDKALQESLTARKATSGGIKVPMSTKARDAFKDFKQYT